MRRWKPNKNGLVWISVLLIFSGLLGSFPAVFLASTDSAHEGLALETSTAPAAGAAEDDASGWKETLFKWMNFVLLFGALGYFLRKPFKQFLATRSEEIRKSLAEAKAAKENAERELATVMSRLEQIEKELAAMKNEAAAQTEADRQQILEVARQEAKQIVSSAHEEVALLVKNARQELRRHSAAFVVQMAEQKIKSAIRPEHQKPLFEKFVGSLQEGNRSK